MEEESAHDAVACSCNKCLNARMVDIVKKSELGATLKEITDPFCERHDKWSESMVRNVQEMKSANAAFQDATTATLGRMVALVDDLVTSHKRLRQGLVQVETRLSLVADTVKKMKTEDVTRQDDNRLTEIERNVLDTRRDVAEILSNMPGSTKK